MPSFEARPCSRAAMRFDVRMTASRVYPNAEPPARSVAQFPGSMYPTATRYPGPANANIFRQKPAPSGMGTEPWTSGRLTLPLEPRHPFDILTNQNDTTDSSKTSDPACDL